MICAYILKCNDGTFYVGSTSNLERRLIEHKSKQNGYTKSRLPIQLVFKKEFRTLTEARKFEYFIKKQRNVKFYQKLINGAFV